MRNANSRFALNPNINIGRSKFARPADRKFSANIGEIIPFYVDEVLPGDTMEVKTNKVIRLQTPVTPFMDNIYADVYWFYTPNRLVYEHWRQLMGENTASAWTPQVEYTVPQVTAPESTGWTTGTIADYMGLPIGVPGISVSALPFRAYALICNEWFRAEQLQDPFNIPVGDATTAGSNGSTYVTDLVKGGKPFIASKFADYFTSCLPAPQRGPEVSIPLTDDGNFPVVTADSYNAFNEAGISTPFASLRWKTLTNIYPSPEGEALMRGGLQVSRGSGVEGKTYVDFGSEGNTGTYFEEVPVNLMAVNDGQIVGASINSLRLAFQIQKLYEKDARGGGRYIEILKSHFGVTSPDARLQRPEYLGGNRIPITVNQVIQQSATSDVSPQGNVAAMSLTVDSHHDFKHSFVEHGLLIGLCVLRYDHSYQQGIERFWSRKDRFDFYWPVLANIGEQAVLQKEIYATGTEADDNGVFGYQEAWADYRYKPSQVSGEMRSAATTSLDSWHLADDYAAAPSLSSEWLMEDKSNVDRVLAVSSEVSNQFFADFYVQNWSTRAMPVFSIPGLIDHH